MKRVDYKLIMAIICISLIGCIMIYSSSSVWAEYKFGDAYKYLKAQVMFLIIGYVLLYIVMKVDYRKYFNKANILFGVCFLLLILVLIPGIGMVRNGSRSWFGIGGFGMQPSEFMKLGLTIFVSKYLVNNDRDIKDIRKGIFPILGIIFLVFALIMLQPDFGTGVVMTFSLIVLLFVSGCRLGFFVKLGALGIVGIVVLILIAPYRMERIVSFLNPWSDPLGSGFQIIQSLYAIGPGGLLGLGMGNSIQKHFYLPEPQTDFIFAIICEELGFVGAGVVILLFGFIIYRGFSIAIHCNDLFGKYLAFGITFMFAFQAILNLSVVVGLIPVTGVTLPFLSYGGSSLLITMISMGILLNISKK